MGCSFEEVIMPSSPGMIRSRSASWQRAVRPALILILLAAPGWLPAGAQKADARGLALGTPALASAGPLAFSDDGVLFVGDALGAAVFAIAVVEPAAVAAEPPRIEGFDRQLAGLLGTTASEVMVHDLAVHPRSHAVYLSAARGRGADAQPVLVRVVGNDITVLDLVAVRFARASLAKAPKPDAKDRRGRSLRTLAITDLKYRDGTLYIAGLSNEEFSSSLRTLRFPFKAEGTFSTVEIYHGAHGRYETHAPIRTLLPIDLDGTPQLLASYTCTPLVTLPLESLRDGQHVKGKTVAELGYGNTPLDMLRVEKDGKTFVYMVNNRRGGMKIDPADIVAAGAITAPVEGMLAGVPFIPMPFAGILRMDDFDDQTIVYLRRDLEGGGLSLRGQPKRFL